MKKGKLIYEGSTKKIIETDQPNRLIQEFKDNAVSSNGKKKSRVAGKGALNNKISGYLFEYLDSYHIPNHFVQQHDERSMVVKKMDILPIEVIIRNIAADSFSKRFNIEENKQLECPVFEYFLKDENLDNPMINEYHAQAFGFANSDEMRTISRIASKVNAVLKAFFERREIKLVECTLEFGRYHGQNQDQILLGGEISPESLHIWDNKQEKNINNDSFFLKDSGIQQIFETIISG